MPIHDLGYRAWEGRTTPQAVRWWVITQTGIRMAWRNAQLRQLLFFSWLPALYLGAAFFMYEQWLSYSAEYGPAMNDARQRLIDRAEELGSAQSPEELAAEARQMVESEATELAKAAATDAAMEQARRRAESLLPGLRLTSDRHDVWSWLIWMFFRYPQGFVMLLVVGLVAPPLVAKDVGSRAFLIYFSRPIDRWEYILGKLAIVWVFVVAITTLPALALYLLGVLLSPDLSVVLPTWDLPLRILVASAVLLIPTTTLALAFSAATTKSWLAGFGWFAVWIWGFVAYGILSATIGSGMAGARQLDPKWVLVSLYHTLGEVQGWVFGIDRTFSDVVAPVILLAGVTIGSLAVLFHRISAPMRI